MESKATKLKENLDSGAPKRSLFSFKHILISSFVLCTAYFSFLVFNSSSGTKFLFDSFEKNQNIQKKTFSSGDISSDQDKMASASDESWKAAANIYEFSAKDIDGNNVSLEKYKGRVALIVNVACMCGLTSGNYPELEQLYKKYEPEGLSVLGFPCNQFGGQEPKPEKEIKEFIKQYDVTFDMFAKINVNGGDAHPLYKYLKSKVDGTFGSFIKWNFSKFLINKEGVPVKRYSPTTKPSEIENDILNLLKEPASKI